MSESKAISQYELLEQRAVFNDISKLSDAQLLSLVLRNAKDKAICQGEKLIEECDKLADLLNLTPNDITRICGANKTQALSLCATFEIVKRVSGDGFDSKIDSIRSNTDVVSLFKERFSRIEVEELWVLYLTATNKIIKRVKISSGCVSSTFADVKLILKGGVEMLASAMIIVHNHPSGECAPSTNDCGFTLRLKEAATMLDVKLLDHVIISKNGSFSFLEAGKM